MRHSYPGPRPATVKAKNLRKGDVLEDGRKIRGDVVDRDGDPVCVVFAGKVHDYLGGSEEWVEPDTEFKVQRFAWETV